MARLFMLDKNRPNMDCSRLKTGEDNHIALVCNRWWPTMAFLVEPIERTKNHKLLSKNRDFLVVGNCLEVRKG